MTELIKLMNTHNLHLTALFVILTVAGPCSSCKDKTKETETVCTPDNTVLVPQDMKDRFFFKEGTYWIYKNLATNEIDSVWVQSHYFEKTSVDDEYYGNIKDKCYESFGIEVISQKFSRVIPCYNTLGITLHPKVGKNLNNELFSLIDVSPLTDNAANYRIENRDNKYENQMGANIEVEDSIVTVDSIVYKNILHIYYDIGTSTYDYLLDMYYVKNKGLVKFKRRTDNSQWELIRSHIVQ